MIYIGYYLQTYISYTRGHAIVYLSSTANTSIRCSAFLCCASQCIHNQCCSSIYLLMRPAQLEFLPLVIFWFYRVRSPTPQTFGKNIEGSTLFLMVSTRFLSPGFSDGATKFSEKLDGAFCMTWPGGFVPIFSSVYALVSGLIINPTDM